MSVNELSFILAKHEGNLRSASNISSRILHNDNGGTQPLPEHATSARFPAEHSAPVTTTNLPRYPLQAPVNNYPPPRVVDTTLAPSSANAASASPLAHTATNQHWTLNVMRQTLETVASAALSAVISPDASMSDAVSLQISGNNESAENGLPMPATAVAVSHGANEIIAVIKYGLFLLVIGSIIAIRILA